MSDSYSVTTSSSCEEPTQGVNHFVLPNQTPNQFEEIILSKETHSMPSDDLESNLRNISKLPLSEQSTPLGTPLSGSNENIVNNGDDDYCENVETESGNNLITDLKTKEQQLIEKLKATLDENNKLVEQISLLKESIRSQENQFGRTVEDIKQTYNERLDKCTKDRDSARKDLESMVVKYARSEKDVISIKKLKDDAEKKLRDALKDKESLHSRIRALSTDKQSLRNSLDQKIAEVIILQKEVDELRCLLKEKDNKLSEAQEIVKNHAEENQSLRAKIVDHPSENGQDGVDQVKTCPVLATSEATVSEDNKSDDLKLELKTLKEKFTSLENENHCLTLKVQSLERERLDHEEVVSKLKDSLNKLNSEYLAATAKLKDMDELKVAINREKELLENTKNEVTRLTDLNNELTTEMEACRHKEGELLEFTERLTAKSVILQGEHNALEEKCASLEEEITRLRKDCDIAQKDQISLKESLTKEKSDHESEVTLMARKVAEKNELLVKYKARKEELENEIKVMKKKHLNTIRELNKELVVMKKHMEECENNKIDKASSQNNSETASNCSQSSSSSPNASSISNQSKTVSDNNYEDARLTANSTDLDSIPNVDKQMLINKIFRLQKTIAKKQEKIDFLEEHNHQLLQEMKKKTKLIQHYITREEAGALTTNRMDENKKQLAEYKTVMSSLYKSDSNDSGMTLSLSLEINRRLQAVLEDTILKNITLKENLDTLGEEIAKLLRQRDDGEIRDVKNAEKSVTSLLAS